MCWSLEASLTLATVGLGTTAYTAYKKQPTVLWLTLGYFSLMELLQAYTYAYLGQCFAPENQIATLLGYLHIAFQPFFVNALSMYFIPAEVRERIKIPVYAFCLFSAIFMLIQLYPFEWAGVCDPRRPLCGEVLCSVRGNWHLAWLVPTNGIGNSLVDHWFPLFRSGFLTYPLAAFFLPVLYGSWRFTIYHYLMGPFLASQLTDNINERPAVWCLLSIGFLILVMKTPIRNWLHVKNWLWWRYLNRAEGK